MQAFWAAGEGVTSGLSLSEQPPIQPIQGLDRTLFIDTEKAGLHQSDSRSQTRTTLPFGEMAVSCSLFDENL